MDKKLLFYGGIFGPLVFLLVDIIGGIITPDYNYIINAVSELIQAGSKNTYLLSPFFLISAIMTVAFGIGMLLNYKDRRSKLLFTASILIITTGIFSGLTGTIFPMDPFNSEMTFAGIMHIILTGISAVFVMLLILMIGIGFHREKQWKSFRLYSIITVIIMVVFGGLTPALIMNSIPLLGFFERIVIYAYLLWFFVLAFKLLK
ncbi:MAG: DUF998 domain-containing protein [Candidatus Bathyarchaeota archaeon]|nr:DUF998 domain-containing protein [Candidatus Bathyarchaeota archaeon]